MTDISGGGRGAHSVGGGRSAPSLPPVQPPPRPVQTPAQAKAAQARAFLAAREAEAPELRYMRETRNAVVFIAWVVGIVCVISLILGIVAGVQLAKVNSQLSNLGGGTSSSNCMSHGGTDPSC